VPPDRDLPSPVETRLAYAAALFSTFVWVTAVMPGVLLADRTLADDLASTMHRGAVFLVPALLLLVAVPVAVVLARQSIALRGLLAWSAVFVATYAAVALGAARPTGFRWFVVAALGVAAAASLRDALVLGRARPDADGGPGGPRTGDVRLAVSLLALLTPAGLFVFGHDERATWLVPFVFLAIGAAGERFATSLRALRVAAVLGLLTLALHLAVGVRFALVAGTPAARAWTAWGIATFVLALVVLALLLGWSALLVPRGRSARASEVVP